MIAETMWTVFSLTALSASLNIRCDRRFNFRGSNLTLTLSLWNVLNRKNVAAVTWNAIGRKPGKILGWGLLPVLGVEFEF